MTTHYRQLTQAQRYQIESGLACGMSQVRVAKQLGVHPATISREVRRNGGTHPYKADAATKKSDARRASAGKFCKPRAWLKAHLPLWLEQGFSPEQIAQRLKLEQPDQAVSHEWIYRFIDVDKRADGLLYLHLRHRRKRYRKRYGSHDRRGQLCNRVSITERPVEAETRERLGDWEGDTVHGVGGNLVTLVDRKSGYLSAYPVKRRTRRQVTRAINLQFKGHVVHTLTLDNGKEFAGHEHIALKSGCQVYFADPYASCQRGTNENTNGLLRQYFPKGSDFSKLTVAAVNRVVAKINLRPRKRLGWKTPYEVYAGVSVALMS
ncbi:IS30 family transposase [Shewanella baltica]|uniref:IS30 family transposase n=1 Tax=Shewanella baltica TaxID=62322 RepID=UPI0030CFDA0C